MAGEDVVAAIVLLVLAVLLYFYIIARRYVHAEADQALVVYGKKGKDGANFRVLPPGSGMFIPPIVAQHRFLDLASKVMELRVEQTITKQGVPVTIELVCLYRLSPEPAALKRAAEALISKTQAEKEEIVHTALASGTRAAAAKLTVEELNADRDGFGKRATETVQAALDPLGVQVLSLVVKDLSDEVGYLEAMGKARSADVIRDAIIKEATARRDAEIAAAELLRQGQEARATADAAKSTARSPPQKGRPLACAPLCI